MLIIIICPVYCVTHDQIMTINWNYLGFKKLVRTTRFYNHTFQYISKTTIMVRYFLSILNKKLLNSSNNNTHRFIPISKYRQYTYTYKHKCIFEEKLTIQIKHSVHRNRYYIHLILILTLQVIIIIPTVIDDRVSFGSIQIYRRLNILINRR